MYVNETQRRHKCKTGTVSSVPVTLVSKTKKSRLLLELAGSESNIAKLIQAYGTTTCTHGVETKGVFDPKLSSPVGLQK